MCSPDFINCLTIAYTYIGPELTHPIYKDGTIGAAKEHLRQTANELNDILKEINGQALLSVNKALVTQASAAIPVVPLYISLLYKLMKEKGTHEGCIEQMDRLFRNNLYDDTMQYDEQGQIRLDNFEMDANIQAQIANLWPQITSENVEKFADVQGYCDDFYKLFGFGAKGVDYNQEVQPQVNIPSIQAEEVPSK